MIDSIIERKPNALDNKSYRKKNSVGILTRNDGDPSSGQFSGYLHYIRLGWDAKTLVPDAFYTSWAC